MHKLAVMINRTHLLAVLLLLAASPGLAEPVVATFSITAADPESGEVGVAVASRFFSVGSVVPYGEGAVGAVATQAKEQAFLETKGTLADRMYAALIAGHAKGGDLDVLRKDDRFSNLLRIK